MKQCIHALNGKAKYLVNSGLTSPSLYQKHSNRKVRMAKVLMGMQKATEEKEGEISSGAENLQRQCLNQGELCLP